MPQKLKKKDIIKISRLNPLFFKFLTELSHVKSKTLYIYSLFSFTFMFSFLFFTNVKTCYMVCNVEQMKVP